MDRLIRFVVRHAVDIVIGVAAISLLAAALITVVLP